MNPPASESTPASPFATPRIDPARLAIGALGALAATAIVVLLIGRFAGFSDLADTMEAASWGWLTLCVAGQIGVFVGYAGAFRHAVAFEAGPEVAPRFAVRVALASFGVTQLVAAGGTAGLAFTYWVLRRCGMVHRDALVRLIGLNTAVYFVFGLVGLLAAAVSLFYDSVPLGMSLGWLVAVPVIVGAARWFTQPTRVARWSGTGDGLFHRLLGIGVESAAWVRRTTVVPGGQLVLMWGALYWIGDLVSLWAALRSFGASPAPAALVLAYVTGYVAQAVPIPLIATSGVDTATTLTLTAVGVPVEVALLGVVAHRVFAFWLPIGPGLWSAFSLLRDSRRADG